MTFLLQKTIFAVENMDRFDLIATIKNAKPKHSLSIISYSFFH